MGADVPPRWQSIQRGGGGGQVKRKRITDFGGN
jgi:hypothetical protein